MGSGKLLSYSKGEVEAQIEQLRKLPPLERLGQPEDVANIIS
jgi:hypothetical protein